MAGNPTGCMGLSDYLGKDFRSKAGLPIVNVPGCPVQPDNFMETLLYLLYEAAGLAPIIPLDDQLRPTWLFGKTVHEDKPLGRDDVVIDEFPPHFVTLARPHAHME